MGKGQIKGLTHKAYPACLKVFFLYVKGILVKKWTNSTEKLLESPVELKPLAAQMHVRSLKASALMRMVETSLIRVS